ncbi:MAG: glycosyltransferase family 4 protein [Bacteroidetes bacterium]|nr:glycosyltransferase family 4 protein [Bacteroidota bacterium]
MTKRSIRLLRVTTAPISLRYLLGGQLEYMKASGLEVLAVSADGPEVKQVIANGIPLQVVPMTRQVTPFWDLYCLWCLIKVIRDFKPDVVHSHTPKAGLLAMLAARITGVKVRMHTVAGLPLMRYSGFKRWLLGRMEWLTYSCATYVHVNSSGLRDFILNNITRRFPLHLIGRGSSNWVDVQFFSPENFVDQGMVVRKTNFIPEDALVYCFVGRLVKDKGVQELVLAFDKIRLERPEAYLMLVGYMEPELDPLPKQIIDRIESGGGIVLIPFQEDIRPYLAASDVLVLPSYREGFPNVLLQAGAMELPCIATDINGCNEIIRDGTTGFLVEVGNIESLTQAMIKLSDLKIIDRFGKSAREIIRVTYTQQEFWEQLKGIYLNLYSKFGVK